MVVSGRSESSQLSQMDHDRERTLHVAGAQPVDSTVGHATRDVALWRDRIEVPREHHQRSPRPAFWSVEQGVVVDE